MMSKPLAIDLYCGLGGWTEGLMAEGYDVIGFDIERHRYPARDMSASDGTKVRQSGVDFNNPRVGSSANRSFNYANQCAVRDAPLIGGWIEYPGHLVIQDVLTLHGAQFRDATLIVASPPCQAYSYRAMPWKRAKALPPPNNTLFEACFRIQREACEAAGRHIPMVVENVRGAQPWVGRAQWNFGSFYLWGDVPALMPIVHQRRVSVPETIHRGDGSTLANIYVGDSVKGAHGTPGTHWTNPAEHENGVKHPENGHAWYRTGPGRLSSSSPRRKAASAMIAKIPLPLSAWIARCYNT
jgi:hypothetical protein